MAALKFSHLNVAVLARMPEKDTLLTGHGRMNLR